MELFRWKCFMMESSGEINTQNRAGLRRTVETLPAAKITENIQRWRCHNTHLDVYANLCTWASEQEETDLVWSITSSFTSRGRSGPCVLLSWERYGAKMPIRWTVRGCLSFWAIFWRETVGPAVWILFWHLQTPKHCCWPSQAVILMVFPDGRSLFQQDPYPTTQQQRLKNSLRDTAWVWGVEIQPPNTFYSNWAFVSGR